MLDYRRRQWVKCTRRIVKKVSSTLYLPPSNPWEYGQERAMQSSGSEQAVLGGPIAPKRTVYTHTTNTTNPFHYCTVILVSNIRNFPNRKKQSAISCHDMHEANNTDDWLVLQTRAFCRWRHPECLTTEAKNYKEHTQNQAHSAKPETNRKTNNQT